MAVVDHINVCESCCMYGRDGRTLSTEKTGQVELRE